VHIHTNDPGLVMQEALKFGELIKIKIENMKEQHGSILEGQHIHEDVAMGEKKAFGFVAVAMGQGLADVYRDLKVDYIIEGGQTMNPSTEDIKKAIDQVHAEHIFILPNNSNIILAANQAKELSEASVFVVPTKTVLQGISAMLSFDPHHDAEGNYDEMVHAISEVKSIQITYAVRDTIVNDIQITTDDYLGILDNQIVASGKEMLTTILDSVADAIDDSSEIVTIYYGEDVSEEDALALCDVLETKYDDIEFEVYPGKQPIYYYLISVE
jgi:DAK2 domain fusion protein YloV